MYLDTIGTLEPFSIVIFSLCYFSEKSYIFNNCKFYLQNNWVCLILCSFLKILFLKKLCDNYNILNTKITSVMYLWEKTNDICNEI